MASCAARAGLPGKPPLAPAIKVLVLTKTTEAWIAASDDALAPTTIMAAGSVTVEADSSEDLWSLTVNIGAGDSTAVAGGLVVSVLVSDTLAYVGEDSSLLEEGTDPAVGSAAGIDVVGGLPQVTAAQPGAGNAPLGFQDGRPDGGYAGLLHRQVNSRSPAGLSALV